MFREIAKSCEEPLNNILCTDSLSVSINTSFTRVVDVLVVVDY